MIGRQANLSAGGGVTEIQKTKKALRSRMFLEISFVFGHQQAVNSHNENNSLKKAVDSTPIILLK